MLRRIDTVTSSLDSKRFSDSVTCSDYCSDTLRSSPVSVLISVCTSSVIAALRITFLKYARTFLEHTAIKPVITSRAEIPPLTYFKTSTIRSSQTTPHQSPLSCTILCVVIGLIHLFFQRILRFHCRDLRLKLLNVLHRTAKSVYTDFQLEYRHKNLGILRQRISLLRAHDLCDLSADIPKANHYLHIPQRLLAHAYDADNLFLAFCRFAFTCFVCHAATPLFEIDVAAVNKSDLTLIAALIVAFFVRLLRQHNDIHTVLDARKALALAVILP